jgi:glycosyltransferase involved in cell wall biosynthesis
MESILAQSYDAIEFILVNDGSTDATQEIAERYVARFAQRGYRFVRLEQENRGLGAAIDAGLKVFTGEFLCWADADDFYAPQSVEKRVEVLRRREDVVCVTSDAYVVREGALDVPIGKVSDGVPHNDDPQQMEHLLRSDSIFCAGCHMLRARAFVEANHGRDIYPHPNGQNWQMLLPIYSRYPRVYLDESLYYYVKSDSNMTATACSKEDHLQRIDGHMDIITNTLARLQLPPEKMECYLQIVRVAQAKKRFSIAYTFRDADLARQQLRILKSYRSCDWKLRVKYLLLRLGR